MIGKKDKKKKDMLYAYDYEEVNIEQEKFDEKAKQAFLQNVYGDERELKKAKQELEQYKSAIEDLESELSLIKEVNNQLVIEKNQLHTDISKQENQISVLQQECTLMKEEQKQHQDVLTMLMAKKQISNEPVHGHLTDVIFNQEANSLNELSENMAKVKKQAQDLLVSIREGFST
ncbi:hypothetical protein [Enterococcus sp. N342-3-1-2]